MLLALPAPACITLTSDGKYVQTQTEAALIVWDEERHLEHFIREAAFVTKSKDVGFLVPTPSVPVLADVNREIFQTLAEISSRLRPPSKELEGMKSARSPGFQVVHQQEVAGYNSSILAGQDAAGITRWLKENGYPTNQSTEYWLKPYLAKGWAITAFKLGPQKGVANLEPVRLTFQTDHPIYPYREPKGGSAPGRTLRIYLLSAAPLEAKKGEAAWTDGSELGALTELDYKNLGANLGNGVELPKNLRLTEYNDPSVARDGSDDIKFVPGPVVSVPVRSSVPLTTVLAVISILLVMGIVGLVGFLNTKRPR